MANGGGVRFDDYDNEDNEERERMWAASSSSSQTAKDMDWLGWPIRSLRLSFLRGSSLLSDALCGRLFGDTVLCNHSYP